MLRETADRCAHYWRYDVSGPVRPASRSPPTRRPAPNGQFASTPDPEGNPIELWEPTPTGSRSLPTATADPRPTKPG
jgi:hypothetical protein